MGATAAFILDYVSVPPRRRRAFDAHYATAAAIASAIGSAIASGAAGAAAGAGALGSAIGTGATAAGSALASGASAVGSALGSVPGLVGGALTGSGSGVGGAIGSGALGEAGTAALGGAIPGGITFAGPSAGLTAGETAAMLPTALSTPASFGGGAASTVGLGAGPPAPTGGFPGVSNMLQGGLDLYTNPGQNIGGFIGKQFGNEQLGQQIGQVGQIMAASNQKQDQPGFVPPAPPPPSIAMPQAPPMPGMEMQGGPTFHFNAQGMLEYS